MLHKPEITPTALAEALSKLKNLPVEDAAVSVEEQRRSDPMYQRELMLEEKMLSAGRQRQEETQARAAKRKNRSHLAPYRHLTEEMLGGITETLAGWLDTQAEAKHTRGIAFKPLATIPAATSALIAIRTLLDSYEPSDRYGGGSRGVKTMSLAYRTGRLLEQEARMLAWEKTKPGIWHAVQQQLSDNKATILHRRRVNNNRFNAKVRDAIGWIDWTADQCKHVGLRLIDCMVTGSGHRIQHIKDPDWTGKPVETPWVVIIDEETTQWLLHELEHDKFVNPVFMPMVMPPAQWSHMWDGGYITGILPQRSLVRFKADNQEQAKLAIAELGKVSMPQVYEALNTVQEVPWRINDAVLSVAEELWAKDLGLGVLPRREAQPIPHAEKLDDPKVGTPMQRTLWRREAAKAHQANRLHISTVEKARRTLSIALEYRHDIFYFPHVLDFRGRMYPVPVDLQPQGEDFSRGLLTFAEGKPLGPGGVYWLAVHLANVWGKDKISFEKRLEWVEKNTDMFERIAEDPVRNRRWTKADEPWQALAATLEWVRYLRTGLDMVCALPVRVDGTCNGIQHLSAMVRDEDGGAAVNLLPGDTPRDIYTEVGKQLAGILYRESVEASASSERKLAARWLELVNGVIPRVVTKRPVMILPYGGTKRAYQKYTDDWFAAFDPDFKLATWQERNDLVNYLVDLMWSAVEAKLPRAREVQKWLQQCARIAATAHPPRGVTMAGKGLPLRWQTPCGFLVRHFYGKHMGSTIKTNIDGQVVRLTDVTITKDLDIESQLQGIPPNFTHSMDASVLMTTMVKAWNSRIDMLTCIHDAYGTVPADVDMLNKCLREAFIWTYQQPVLKNFRDECLALLDDDITKINALPNVPRMGKLDIEQVRDSTYFFA